MVLKNTLTCEDNNSIKLRIEDNKNDLDKILQELNHYNKIIEMYDYIFKVKLSIDKILIIDNKSFTIKINENLKGSNSSLYNTLHKIVNESFCDNLIEN